MTLLESLAKTRDDIAADAAQRHNDIADMKDALVRATAAILASVQELINVIGGDGSDTAEQQAKIAELTAKLRAQTEKLSDVIPQAKTEA